MKLLDADTLHVTGREKGIIMHFWETAHLPLP